MTELTTAGPPGERAQADAWDHPSWSVASVYSPILSGALDAFSEHGYHGATVRDIARRVGVNVPQLYYRHASKESLLDELLHTSIIHLEELVRAASLSALEPQLRFCRMIESVVRFSCGEIKIIRLSSEIRSMSAGMRDEYVRHRHEVERLVAEALLQGIAQGRFDSADPQHDVRAILGMIQAMSTWFHPEGPLDADALVERYVRLSLRMVGGVVPTGVDGR